MLQRSPLAHRAGGSYVETSSSWGASMTPQPEGENSGQGLIL